MEAEPPQSHTSKEDGEDLDRVYEEQARLEGGGDHDQQDQQDAFARAKDFLAKKKQELTALIKMDFKDQMSSYDAVRSHNIRALELPNLFGGYPDIGHKTDGFFETGDGRMSSCVLHTDFGAKTNVSLSFDPHTLDCMACGNHKVLSGSGRPVIILADQEFSPIIPSDSEKTGNCLLVIRVECGTIAAIIREFLELSKSVKIPVGTLVLLSSATHMATVGTSEYVKDLVVAKKKINQHFGGEVEVVPCPPLLIGSTDNHILLRTLCEVSAWIHSFSGVETALRGAFSDVVRIMTGRGGKGSIPSYPAVNIILPSDMSREAMTKYWRSELPVIPASFKGITEKEEQAILVRIVELLKSELNVDIDPPRAASRLREEKNVAARPVGGKKRILVVGASNAKRTADAIQRKGHVVDKVVVTNWKVSKASVEGLAELVQKAVKECSPELVVVQLLDNILYLASSFDGTATQAARREDGSYHVEGDLTLASKQTQFSLYNAIKPILQGAGQLPMIILTPMPRYITQRCCDNVEHVTNFGQQDYYNGIKEGLDEIRRNFKNFAFSDNVRRIRVLNPTHTFAATPVEEVWPEDPVHPCKEIYDKIAEMVLRTSEDMDGKRKTAGPPERPREGGHYAHSSGQRGWRHTRGKEWGRSEKWNEDKHRDSWDS